MNDLVEFRIDAVLQEMSTATLCVLPEDEPCTCEEFVQTTKVHIHTYTSNKCIHSNVRLFSKDSEAKRFPLADVNKQISENIEVSQTDLIRKRNNYMRW